LINFFILCTGTTIRGVVGIHFDRITIEELVFPLFSRTNAQISIYIWDNQQNVVISKDQDEVLTSSADIKNNFFSSSLYSNRELSFDVVEDKNK
jgi:hypothetical protein